MYEKEVVEQSEKVEKMKAENKDEHDIKKQVCGWIHSVFVLKGLVVKRCIVMIWP